ncbi:N-acetylglutaminylglutamine amidotransferase [Geodermatophilus sp. URMC 64]
MCGLAGDIRFDGSPADREAVARMAERQRSRGPDGEGAWDDGWIALGHRRLAVIDPSGAGAQPMVDEELGLAVVFNGCIYNHAELREQLRAAGHRFRSTSDTEVLLKAWATWGESFVDHLVGMFALALVDRRARRVVLARDRLGIKPLYLAETPGRLRFASTLPALLGSGPLDTSLDLEALHHYFTWHSIVPGRRTVVRGVRKLPPATLRVVEADGSSRERVYWQPRYERSAHPEREPAEWRAAVHDALRTAVARRTVSDVPVGVLLSGGVDSSLVVALLADLGHPDLRTFSIGFESDGSEAGDEFQWSDLVAGGFGTEHTRIQLTDAELPDAVDGAVEAMSEPMGSHDTVAFFLLAREVSRHVKVVQSGQGADEVFAGYDWYRSLARVPRERAAEEFGVAFDDRAHDELADVLTADHRCPDDVSRAWLAEQVGRPGAETALDAVLRLDVHGMLPDDPVKRVDNMTMAWGLESRVPFLDQDVVALAAACPPELKLAQGGKGILKDVARPLLPHGVVDRPKGYFPVPGVRTLAGPLLDRVQDVLTSPTAKERALFEPAYLDAVLADPGGRLPRTGGNRLWQLAVLEMWLQTHGIGGSEPLG